MKTSSAALLALILVVGAGVPAVAVAQHSRDPHAGAAREAPGLALDAGSKWATDAALRRSMEDIRFALVRERQSILDRSLGDERSRALGRFIEGRVAAIVAECKLEPKADANLHVVVAELAGAAGILQGKSKQDPVRGAAKAVRAAQLYATYFDHPGWRPIHGDESSSLASAQQ